MSIDRALKTLSVIEKDTFSSRDYSAAHMAATGRIIRNGDMADDIRTAMAAGYIEQLGYDRFRECRIAR